MKIILLSFCLLSSVLCLAASPIPTPLAVRAIVGEAAGEGERGMLAVAGALRNRGTLSGVFGLKSPVVNQSPAWVWRRAERAWAMSATNDITGGATHWENVQAFGRPAWSQRMTITLVEKHHTFFKSHGP